MHLFSRKIIFLFTSLATLAAIFLTTFEIDVKPRLWFMKIITEPSLLAKGEELQRIVTPDEGIMLDMTWGDLGKQMTEAGVIDREAFERLYQQRQGGLSAEEKQWLTGSGHNSLRMTPQNAGLILNLLWAFGLSNKNEILDSGPMGDPQYGGADRFASTGGWGLSKGNPMDHYSHYAFVTLTAQQQEMVQRIAQHIFRPCCGNSTHFPDCNHGMAMLGLLELLAANSVTEEEMYQTALQVNAYWFPTQYHTIAKYFQTQSVPWSEVDPLLALGSAYSSGSGYQRLLSLVEPAESRGGGGCGV